MTMQLWEHWDNMSNEEILRELLLMIGVRIDIWTHLMRECIINYVH